MKYLEAEDLAQLAEEILGEPPLVRDWGLLGSAAARPQTAVFGIEPYPSVAEKAAALLVSVALNHALVDGNKRLALAAGLTLYWLNTGVRLAMSNDEAYELVIAVCEHKVGVPEVAEAFRKAAL